MTTTAVDHARTAGAAAGPSRTANPIPYGHPSTTVIVDGFHVPWFDVITERDSGRLELAGEFDLAGSHRFLEARSALLAGGAAEVVVELARLSFIDSTGVGLLRDLRNDLVRRDADLRVVNADARATRVFSICGLNAMLSVR